MNSGYLKVYRKLKNSVVWWKQPSLEYRGAWLTLLLRANYAEGTFDGMTIPAGTFATSLENLSNELSCSVHKTRTILHFFERQGMITRKNIANRFTVITICNWDRYNSPGEDISTTTANRIHNARQTGGQTDGNNRRYKKNVTKEKKTSSLGSPGGSSQRFARPTLAEVEAYKAELGYENLDCQHFLDVNEAKGWVYGKHSAPVKDWKALLRCWKRMESATVQPDETDNELRDQLDKIMEG